MIESLQAKEKFNRARSRADFRAILNILQKERNMLLAFDATRSLLGVESEAARGVIPIPINDIVGSEGRYHDFDRQFLPRGEHLRSRWENIAKAHIRAISLPPIKVFQLGGLYFIRDGNHRVSVARTEGAEFIDADVTELVSDLQIDHCKNAKELRLQLLAEIRVKFLRQSGLNRLEEAEQKMLRFSNPGCYEQAIGHINGHKYFINQRQVGEISFEDAARSWFYNLFLPVVKIITRKHLTRPFPGSLPADLYLWSVARWDELKKRYGGRYPLETALDGYVRDHGASLSKRLCLYLQSYRRRRHE